MISRRNIRVKVMQTLYVIDNMGVPEKPTEPVRLLQKQFDQSRQLLVYLVYFLAEVALAHAVRAKDFTELQQQ